MVSMTAAFKLIEKVYGDRTAKRSGVPLINHITEGVKILNAIGNDYDTIVAFMLHPLWQQDKMLTVSAGNPCGLTSRQLIYVMEYRNIANRSLSDIVGEAKLDGPYTNRREFALRRPIVLSPLDEVNNMLIADKVQNRKDFELHHKGKHDRSEELDFYFRSWLQALGLHEDRYHKLKELIS